MCDLQHCLNQTVDKSTICELLGTAVSHRNPVAISMINLYIVDNNVRLSKSELMREIYYANCRLESSKFATREISFKEWDDDLYHEYLHRYGDLIEYH